MKRFELIVGIIAIFGILLQIRNMPGFGALAGLALMALSIFYYLFSFAFFNDIRLRNIFKKISYKDTNAKRIIGAIGVGWGISLIILGGLSKLQLWAVADMYLLTGFVYIGLILIIATIFYFRNKADYYKKIFRRIIIYCGLGLILYLTPPTTFLDIYYGNNPIYTEHPDFEECYKKVLAEPYNSELKKQLNQMRIELEQMKIEKWLQERNDENKENE